ncbi:MAG: DedA family protein [Gemmatimonadaceae bacterium]|nr:DedA family protein [Gemmatimonadaceae bacterium]
MNVQSVLDWLLSLPPSLLLPAMAILAIAENIFPPIPADVLIALGAFIAARNDASPLPAFLVVLLGNVAGAMAMYAIGRRYGAAWTEERFHLKHKEGAESSLSSWYARYGLLSLAIGRFLPGIRAVVAPFAGALRAPITGTAAAITIASGAWYGLVTLAAFRAGSNWEDLVALVGRMGRWAAIVAIVLAAGLWFAWSRHRRRAKG